MDMLRLVTTIQITLAESKDGTFIGNCKVTSHQPVKLFASSSRGSNGYAQIDVRFPDKNDKLVQTR